MQADKSYRIVSLTANNIKKITAVHIEPDGNIVEITGRNGAGKQQPISEPVLTNIGWQPIGTIEVGDHVIGSNGLPTEVTGVFPQEERKTYLVTMSDGSSTRCGPDHLWTVGFWKKTGANSDYCYDTFSTKDLLKKGLRRGTGKKFSIPIVEPVVFADVGKFLPIDPYTLGIILGDGHIEPSGYCTVTSWDQDILDRIEPRDFYQGKNEIGSADWSRPLRHMGLGGKRAWEKFIPEPYFQATVSERFALLHGLMDADGTAEKSWASFCTTSERLADDFINLAHSLGMVCKKRKGATKKYRYNGKIREGRKAWTVGVKSQSAPFWLERKKERWSKSEQRGDRFRFIDKIEEVEPEDSVCIQVANSDGLYVTKDFILTHNTSVLDAIWWALAGTKNVQGKPIRDGEEQAVISLSLGDVVITRKFKSKEDGGYTTSLKVEDNEGRSYNSPQNILDAIVGDLTFDPLSFTRQKPAEQLKILQSFVQGFDFDKHAETRADKFSERTFVNREIKNLEGQIAGLPDSSEDDEELIDLQEANDAYHNGMSEQKIVDEHNRRILESATAVSNLNSRKVEIEQKIKELQEEMEGISYKVTSLSRISKQENRPDVDLAALKARVDIATSQMEKSSSRESRTKLEEQLVAKREESKSLTSDLKTLDAEQQKAIKSSEIPVEGISFDEDSILFDGIPFNQASDAQQLRAAIGIAMALNPQLKICRVRDGSLIDEDGMKILSEQAELYDFQIWIERVDTSGKSGIVMENGEVIAKN